MLKNRKINGYVLVHDPEHKRAHKAGAHKGFVYEHIKKAEEMLGRPLTESEIVHHLDLTRDNNSYSNLLVLELSQHTKLHWWLDKQIIIPNPLKIIKQAKYCTICGKELTHGCDKYCSEHCYRLFQRQNSNMPDIDQLGKDIVNNTFVDVGKKYNVTDRAVRKWCDKLGLPFRLCDIK